MISIVNNFVFQVAAGVMLVAVLFAATEGVVATAQSTTTDEFIVTQVITGEISFETPANDVSLSPDIASLTGGTSNGSTQVAVSTNEAAGYHMDIAFSNAAAMQRNGGGGEIADYTTAGAGIPDYAFDTSTASGELGYSVVATTAADADPTFRNNGTACNTGASSTAGQCWMTPSTTNERIINRTTSTPATGATTTIAFRVYVPANPSPTIPTGTYTATATLTATTN